MNKFTGDADVACYDALIMTDLVQNTDNYGYIMYLKYLFKNNFFCGGGYAMKLVGSQFPNQELKLGHSSESTES